MIVEGYWLFYVFFILTFLMWMFFYIINDEISEKHRYAKIVRIIATKGLYFLVVLVIPLFIYNVVFVFLEDIMCKAIGITGILTIAGCVYIAIGKDKVKNEIILFTFVAAAIYIILTVFGTFRMLLSMVFQIL